MGKKILWCGFLGVLMTACTSYAQLNQVFTRIFDQVLKEDLRRSPGVHADHFIETAATANMSLTPALNALVASNISSFPLTSTIAGVSFDWSSGRPVSISESLGPIFAETAATLGKGKLSVEFDYTHLSLDEFRGVQTDNIGFTFTHEDVVKDGKPLGDDPFEADVVDFTLDLDVNANIFAFFATMGVTNNLDVSLAVPIVQVSLSGQSKAVLRGPTSGINHFFQGGDVNNPNVTDLVPYDESATGLGDIALRSKYNFLRGPGANFAALLDIRLPTGNKDDFLGTGKASFRASLIASQKIAEFTPHLNFGYNRRPATFDSDKLELIAGFDQKMAERATFAIDFLSTFDVGSDAISFFPEETVTIVENQGPTQITREEDLTNIPTRDQDNTFSASFGVRVAAADHLLFLGNILVPINEGGLRSNVTPTLGITAHF